MPSPASQFIDESVKHPDWLRAVESGDAGKIVQLAKDNGFDCTLEDLKKAAAELLQTNQPAAGDNPPSQPNVDEAASGLSDLEGETGYGDDTGYAALYGVAGVILKL